MDSYSLTDSRFARQAERAAKNAGWGNTASGLGLASRYLTAAAAVVDNAKQYLKPREHGAEIATLSSELIALAGITVGLGSVVSDDTLARASLSFGAALESECYGSALRAWDADRADQLLNRVVKSHTSIKHRRTALRSLAQKANFPWTKWTAKDKALAGRWLMEAMLETAIFEATDEGKLTITQEASDCIADIVELLQAKHPVLLPTDEPPADWTKPTAMLHGYSVSLVRSREKAVQRAIGAAIRNGTLQPSLDALNAAQRVPYRINGAILEMVKWCYAEGINVPGMPPRDDLELPLAPEGIVKEKPDGELTDAFKAHLKGRRDIRQMNRAYLGERISLQGDIATAEHLTGGPFWTPLNWDYRGRVYGIPRFNFQRQDYVRAMFEFDEGQLVDARGLYWLKVHLANCGDFDKVSKRPFDERVKWVDANIVDLMNCARDPKSYRLWIEADKPFLFLAACLALYGVFYGGRKVHIPLAFDGSCSGLQHLGAMTRDANTATLVNLTNGEKPNDVYNVVAEMARRTIEGQRRDPNVSDVAEACLSFGIGRSLVKRNVMTFSYSSKAFGMSEQHMEDTMIPLHYEVLAGKRSEHPFGSDGGHKASRYLAKVVYDAITQTVQLPAQAMGFLQGIAKTMAHEGKPVTWRTPLGFPAVMRYPNVTTTRVKLLLHDKGVQREISPRIAVELAGVDKRRAASAIAPSFVHSLDACHLMMVALAANDAGITNMAFVHDSFGCLPNDAEKFRPLIQREFYELYQHNDVLFDILRENAANLDTSWHRLPNVPEYGEYDMKEVLDARYAFA